jgi:hypothetical protein
MIAMQALAIAMSANVRGRQRRRAYGIARAIDEIYAFRISDITNENWKNISQRSIIHMSPLFSSKEIDSSPLTAGFFFAFAARRTHRRRWAPVSQGEPCAMIPTPASADIAVSLFVLRSDRPGPFITRTIDSC